MYFCFPLKRKKKILVCPLDWGLGHAARCIPIIKALMHDGHHVIIGADNAALSLLKSEFPEVEHVQFPGHVIHYSDRGFMMPFRLLAQLFPALRSVNKEHRLLQRLIKEKSIDLVISDNRYGLWSKEIPSIFVTHQFNVNTIFGGAIFQRMVQRYANKHTHCWIPDVETPPFLAGNLARSSFSKQKSSYHYIGPLSRFDVSENIPDATIYDLMVIVSGPESQRTVFENIVLKQLRDTNLKTIVVRGLPDEGEVELPFRLPENVQVFNHLDTPTFLSYLKKSDLIISRPGYSTIMDLAVLGKKAIFVPTPGQPEQEYLAKYHYDMGHYFYQKQQVFNIVDAMKRSVMFNGLNVERKEDLLSTISSVIS